ncbi:MAG TPA: hypothetical protein VK992_06700 [Candidatus Caenarcaniphilales bacterium]|nr:hypothetical protein [Candidatus Caenarcaniphilales bacterium]
MDDRRQELRTRLEDHYRSQGWSVERAADGTLHAAGPGGVTWVGATVVPTDLGSPHFAERLVELSARRMSGGELCPLDVLAAEECAGEVRTLLDRLGLAGRPHISFYANTS